ncbi:uncharacterized protein LOC127047644 [Gopherus flavomarginatus]|uniref:uncharacterized protein LOC127047644 n=1 Tax=Gopherus flavomarginatus TaxID=286002 RepID=UPI0021CC32BB|nr:uncharacterized protein LOC127047644 [Gopherus flavomarginatus]
MRRRRADVGQALSLSVQGATGGPSQPGTYPAPNRSLSPPPRQCLSPGPCPKGAPLPFLSRPIGTCSISCPSCRLATRDARPGEFLWDPGVGTGTLAQPGPGTPAAALASPPSHSALTLALFAWHGQGGPACTRQVPGSCLCQPPGLQLHDASSANTPFSVAKFHPFRPKFPWPGACLRPHPLTQLSWASCLSSVLPGVSQTWGYLVLCFSPSCSGRRLRKILASIFTKVPRLQTEAGKRDRSVSTRKPTWYCGISPGHLRRSSVAGGLKHRRFLGQSQPPDCCSGQHSMGRR